MTIERQVTLYCDGDDCDGFGDGFGQMDSIMGASVTEVRRKARADGWLMAGGLDLCAECRRPASVREQERWEREEQEYERRKKSRDRLKAMPCSSCGASAGEKCRTANGKPIEWLNCHKARKARKVEEVER